MARQPTGKPTLDLEPRQRSTPLRQLMVRRPDQRLEPWKLERVERSLESHGLAAEQSAAAAARIETMIASTDVLTVPLDLVRELVAAELYAAGRAPQRPQPAVLGLALDELDQVIRGPAAAEADGSPGLSDWLIARRVKAEYALLQVFSTTVVDAHLAGDLHLHGLASVDRPAIASLGLEPLQRHGLQLAGGAAAAGPARHPEVLIAHLAHMSRALHGHVGEAPRWRAVNVAMAPYLDGLGPDRLERLAEMLLHELSQDCPNHPHLGACCVLELVAELPAGLRGRPALGPGGVALDRSHGEFEPAAQAFAAAVLRVYAAGDAGGQGFDRVGLELTVGERLFRRSGYRELLLQAGAAARRGRGLLVRLKRGPEQPEPDPEQAEAVIQVVSLNLPRLGLLASEGGGDALAYLDPVLELAAQAHLDKRVFIEDLMARGAEGPLGLLAAGRQRPLLGLDSAQHVFAAAGLNELCLLSCGQELHAGDQARAFGRRLLREMQRLAVALSRRHKLHFRIGPGAGVGAAARFAELDLRRFGVQAPQPPRIYTPSAGLPAELALDAHTRLRLEGDLNEPLDLPSPVRLRATAGATQPEPLAELLMHAFAHTRCRALELVPEPVS